MKKTKRDLRNENLILILVALLAVALGIIIWQNFMSFPEEASKVEPPYSQVSLDVIEKKDNKTVTSTFKDWSVSLEVPSMWGVKTDYTSTYNYDTKLFEGITILTIEHPSKKASIVLMHEPFFVSDGVCGSSPIQYVSKESMHDDRLIFVEATGDNSFFLSAMTNEAASAITEGFEGCLMYRGLINNEAKGIDYSEKEAQPYYKKPFVSVKIRPAFAAGQAATWDNQIVKDFLQTEEYLELKEIVKTLKI